MEKLKIALAGKPNSGKSSLFNLLTGLNQKIGNFPGVTVDKKSGISDLSPQVRAEIIDLPGIYSLYPRSLDEKIVTEIFSDKRNVNYPNTVVLVADATNLQGSMLLLTQLIDLGLPLVLALNMAARAGQSIDIKMLEQLLDIPVVLINAREGMGISELRKVLAAPVRPSKKKIYSLDPDIREPVAKVRAHFNLPADYEAYQYLQQVDNLAFLTEEEKSFIRKITTAHRFFPGKYQGAETILRYQFIQDLLGKVILKTANNDWRETSRHIDKILTHKIGGYLAFFIILLLIFQSIFAWAQVPMDWIDGFFADLSNALNKTFPEGPFFDLITQGVVPGIGGIVIFIPQIAILFAFISILEETCGNAV